METLILSLDHFDSASRVEEGNRFLIGNGHLGYRGVLEEEGKEALKGFNLVGVYDRYQDKWRESLNLPDPLCFRTDFEGKEEDVNAISPLSHHLNLHLEKGLWERESEFPHYFLHSERFLSQVDKRLLCSKLSITALQSGHFEFCFGLDTDVYDINGPHFKNKKIEAQGSTLLFEGTTNEGKTLYEKVSYRLNGQELNQSSKDGFFLLSRDLSTGESLSLEIFALVGESLGELSLPLKLDYETQKKAHVDAFSALFCSSNVTLQGEEGVNLETSYAIYSLLILGDSSHNRSIPARGVSGQTYKGAIFWDSEIFLLPFFALTNPNVARSLLKYRIATLLGAKKKAKEFGYSGAFYAWESQDSGEEACSLYNVTDYKTGKPIRTYFNEKQIHISADIPYALENYVALTGDRSLLEEGGLEMIVECCLFFLSYAKKGEDGLYHLRDVIGPDEYHERVDDNAFTNYMVHRALSFVIRLLEERPTASLSQYLPALKDFRENLYLPKPNEKGVIEQFRGYFEKEDCTLEEVRSRVKDPREYWGGKEGPAGPTQIIKQADVVAMLVLLGDEFPLEVKKANYDYYFPRTEHGSSLSASMYSLLGTQIGEKEYAYSMFRKSASIDLYGPQKRFAGGIYIGGTHPASDGGAYLALVYGFSGFEPKGEKFNLSPCLPKEIESLDYEIQYRGKSYAIHVDRNEAISKEIIK